jgi:hypothetical protein
MDTYRKSNYRLEKEWKRKRGHTQFPITHGIARREAHVSPPLEISEAPLLDYGGDSLRKKRVGHAYPSSNSFAVEFGGGI